jgi:hypothetical protein
MEARFIVSPSIYVSGQGFGVTWRISYAQVSAQARVTAAQMFDAEETADEPVAAAAAEIPVATEDEDQQEDEETRETPSAAPVPAAPAPAKQARRRTAQPSAI